ncbi:MAG: hypothetical protein ACRD4B_09390, partial [Acidobacteriota bacterium]
VWPEPRHPTEKWLSLPKRWMVYAAQSGVVLLIMAYSWDTYIYPQSHFFLMALFVLLMCLFVAARQSAGRVFLYLAITAYIVMIALSFSNAVTGTAAIIVAMAFGLHLASNKKIPPGKRVFFAATIPLWLLIFALASPGNSSVGMPGFSYVAAVNMVRLSLPLAIIAVSVMWLPGRQPYLSLSAGLLSVAALFIFTFSTRDIVIDNAVRFFYHALLAAFPLLLLPLVRGYFHLRQALIYTTRSIDDRAAAWILSVTCIIFLLLPAAASVASSHDHLMFKDEHVISLSERGALWAIEEQTPKDAIFLANPQPPFSIPAFTGRRLLRADYWLSPDDVVLADTVAAFDGDRAAQEHVISQADYLFLQEAERALWEPLPFKKIFDSSHVVIYKLR